MAEEDLNPKRALRLVLVGWAKSGKSASGNTILGTEEFLSGRRSSKCVSQHAQLAGREVTVVDTPGWVDFSVLDTPESIQKEIISSGVPAPDAVLLMIPLEVIITEGYIHSVLDHLSLLGDLVWSHTIVLFTFGNCLRNQTIESYIESNSALQSLIRSCGNNYHVFENVKRVDGKQVEDLLIKIENMPSNNKLTQDSEEVKSFSEETQTENTADQSSEMECKKPIKPTSANLVCARSHTGGSQCFPELRLVLLGLHKSGKSSTGNTILGSARFGEWTEGYQKEEAEVAGRRLVVIDTPPLQRATAASPDQNLVTWVCQCPPGPHALVFVLNLSSNFTSVQWKFVQRYMEVLGEKAWEHVVVVFTGADVLEGIDMKSFLRNRDASLHEFLDKCGNRQYFFNNRSRRYSTQVTDLLEGIEKLSSQHSPGFYEIDKAVATNMEEMNQALTDKAQKRAQKVAAKERAQQVIFRKGRAHKLPEVRIVLLGEKRSGKTTVAKTMAKLFFQEEKNRDKCVATRTIIDDRIVQVVDTPGWSVHTWGQSTQKQHAIKEALSLSHPGPHAFLITVNLRHSFTENHKTALENNLACLSDAMWKNSIVLFTSGERLRGETIEKFIENQGEDLNWLVEQCDDRYHVFSDTQFKDLPQIRELLEKIDGMVEANSGQYFSDILSQIHNKTPSSERSDPLDMEDDDSEYTPRERKMMEKMKRLQELLQADTIRSVSANITAAKMSLEQTPSEGGIKEIDKGDQQSSGRGTGSNVDITDTE